MKRTPLFFLSRCSLSAAGALVLSAPVLHAADRFWVTTAGGAFGTTTNWSATDGGAGGATVPGAADVANFTLNSTYTTTFAANTTLSALDAENGNVTLDLNGFTCTLTSGGAAFIGQVSGQTGRLTVSDGVMAVDTTGDNLNIGNTVGSAGFLSITSGGSLGTVALRPDVVAGSSGTGTLTVNDNGRMDGATLIIGNGSGVTGTTTVSGPNAVVDLSGTLTVGSFGSGTLNVSSGGTFAGAGAAIMGNNLGADGTVSVSGTGSSWAVTGITTIGGNGDGTLSVTSGGLASSTGAVTMGNASTGFGTATVSGAGSRWNQSGTQAIGSSGLGVMTVSSGGQVVTGSFVNIGLSAGSEGRATVTGDGSQWTVGGSLAVGNASTGNLTVSAGGEVSALSAIIGSTATGIGEATVTGSGSRLTSNANVTVASLGSGTLNVSSGGEVYAGTGLTVNDPAGAQTGTLNLDGGSVFVTGNFTNNGTFAFTDGLLRVAGNFQPFPAASTLTINGDYHADLPTLDLIGSGTTSANVVALVVGDNRRGQLLLREGRVLDLGTGAFAVGSRFGGEGIVSVEGGAQLLTTGNSAVGGELSTAGGKGTLNIAGGTVELATLRLFSDGTINLSSGTLAVRSLPVLDGRLNWTGGTLRLDTGFSLTSTNVPRIFGSDSALNAGQTLGSLFAVTLQTPLIVDGGVLAASNLINQSRLELRSGFLGNVQNDGLLLGDGIITGTITNSAAGRIRVDAGESLMFLGGFTPNAGQMNLQGGSFEFPGSMINSATGFITGRGAIFTDGLVNNGQMAFSGGTMDLYGDVQLNAGSRVATSGAGSVTTFWDDVVHNGTEIFTGAGCSTVFFGSQSGSGSYTGSGTIYFIGDLRPGNSPANIAMAPQVVFNPSNTLTLEIGGLTAGTQHDKLTFTSAATPQVDWSGTLAVTLINGFTPAAGQSFDVLDFDAARDSGSFSTITLPTLPAGLAWDTSALYTTGILRVVTSTGLTFAAWATASGIPGALPTGDHDLDGTANAIEFALGLFPPQPGTTEPIGGLHTYIEGERLRLLFTRPLDRTGVTLRVQASDDLVTWSDVAVSVDSAPFTGSGFVSENRAHPLPEPGLVEVRDILNAATTPRRQMRLHIEISP